MRRCWTCGAEHDLDAPCRQAPLARVIRAAGGEPDLFDDASGPPRFGPVFMATFESEDACCGEGIVPGEDIRADGHGGWIHADDQCEKMVSE